jgi:diguanylate cyclase (GGDEF)-like protein
VTTVLLAVGAVFTALGVTLVVLWILRGQKSAGAGDERIADLVADMNTRMETMVRDLSDALERAKEEGRRNRVLGELAGTIDLDEVLTRTLEAAGAIPGADAALVVIEDAADKPLVATLGLSAEEAQKQAIAGPPDGHDVRSIAISYDYPPDPSGKSNSTNLIRSGVAVPVPGDNGRLGFLTVFTRGEPKPFVEDELRELEELALRAGPAIENARRFREARQLADLDALTNLHNRRYFHETLAREVARGQRYDRKLALIVFDLDDFKAINDRIGHLAGDAVLAEVAERVREVVRSADFACRVGGDEFAVILPESTLADADQLYRRLQAAVAARPVAQGGRLSLSAGVADLKPEDDPTSFFERADEALYRAKERGKAQVVSANSA